MRCRKVHTLRSACCASCVAQEASILYLRSRTPCPSSDHTVDVWLPRRPARTLSCLLTLAAVAATGCSSSDPGDQSDSQEVDGGSAPHADAGHAADAKTGTVTTLMNHGTSDASGGSTCESITINAQPNPPDVLIVLDRSGSMTSSNPNRWNPSSSVIKKITKQLDQTMNFGMMLFPDPKNTFGIVCDVGTVTVPIGPGTSAAIAKSIDASPPTTFSATPTAATLHAALTAIDSDPPCADSCAAKHKYVLLVTDGQPNCGTPGAIATNQSDIDACNTGIDALKTAGVTTYVIGYDTASDAQTAKIMDGFAKHGGTGKQLPVEDEASLLATLTNVAGQLVSCDYTLSSVVEDPSFISVALDGTPYYLGTGWTLGADKKTITLGSACDKLRDAQSHLLQIALECSQVIAI
ncbi:MAG: putative secreted protein [Myxococcaceae bacterium]|nr:putative secreted protein [Myxococcaceae bacterium]